MSTQPQQEQQALTKQGSTSPLIIELAGRWKMTPQTMINTIKATVFPNGGKDVSDAQLMMLLQVAHHYDLSPFLRELYAFPTRGGGIVPMVPIDGWANIINRNPQMDGVQFRDEWDVVGGKKTLVATTCVIHRKDRQFPTEVTEYLSECFQPGKEPWVRWPARMLRHKSLIQCARIAFSLGGIYDPDEAERIAEVGGDEKAVITRPTRASAQTIDAEPVTTGVAQAAVVEQTAGEAKTETSSGASTAKSQPGSAYPACFCNCCKSGTCTCSTVDEFNRCGCGPCKLNVAAPVIGEESKTRTEGTEQSQPTGTELFPQAGQRPKPEGPFISDKQRAKLIIASKAVGWSVTKDSKDDPLHKFLLDRYGVISLTEVPSAVFEEILKAVGNSGDVKMNLK